MPTTKTKSALERLDEIQREMDALQAKREELEALARVEDAAEAFDALRAALLSDPATVNSGDLVAVLRVLPDDVVKRAVVDGGYAVKPAGRPGGTSSRSSGRTRAPRLSLDDVIAKLPAKGTPWKVVDLAAAIDRETGTTRNFLPKLLEAGKIVEAGDDGGTPRAAKLYTTA